MVVVGWQGGCQRTAACRMPVLFNAPVQRRAHGRRVAPLPCPPLAQDNLAQLRSMSRRYSEDFLQTASFAGRRG